MSQVGDEVRVHLALKSATIARGGKVLIKDLSAEFPRGSFVALLGPSGAGKTTLLSTLAGLVPVGGGEVEFTDRGGNVISAAGFTSRLGLVFQHLRLTLNSSAQANVLCGLLGARPWWRTLFGFSSADRDRANRLLTSLGLPGFESIETSRLSGGERQRVALARALIADPEWILADEPVSHLDPDLAHLVLALLRQSCLAGRASVFCSLHQEALAHEFAHVVIRVGLDGTWEIEKSR